MKQPPDPLCANCGMPLSPDECKRAINGDESLFWRYLHECFRYEAETGDFYWRVRPLNHFPSDATRRMWNTRFSLKKTGSQDSCGYTQLRLNHKSISAHRTLWFMVHGTFPNEIDHINHLRSDNRIENLREVTRLENTINIRVRKDNLSGVTGVSYREKRDVWIARITVKKRIINLGQFSSKDEAINARKEAEILYGFSEIKSECAAFYEMTDPNHRMEDEDGEPS